MTFDLSRAIEILQRTPAVLNEMLRNISSGWTSVNEGGDSWTVYDIIGHFIHGEKTDWVPRMDIILSNDADKRFTPFDRFAQFEQSKGKSLTQLLEEFTELRKRNIDHLVSKQLTPGDLEKKGIHPAFGEITLSQLLAAWTVHDLNHIYQIARVMAKQYKDASGPWVEYLRILQE